MMMSVKWGIKGILWIMILLPLQASALFFDSDTEWHEGDWSLPSFPLEKNLKFIDIGNDTQSQFFIDMNSLSTSKEGVIRYSLVVKGKAGAMTATYEGLRCHTSEYRIYAISQYDGSWVIPKNDKWRRILLGGYDRARHILDVNYFCDAGVPPYTLENLLKQIKHSSHYVRGFNN